MRPPRAEPRRFSEEQFIAILREATPWARKLNWVGRSLASHFLVHQSSLQGKECCAGTCLHSNLGVEALDMVVRCLRRDV